jgi:hypothetical protein
MNVSGFKIRHFRRQEVGVPCSGIPEVAKPDTGAEEDAVRDFGVSAFRVSASGRVENLDIRDRETPKPEVLCGLNKGVG